MGFPREVPGMLGRESSLEDTFSLGPHVAKNWAAAPCDAGLAAGKSRDPTSPPPLSSVGVVAVTGGLPAL